LFAIAYTATSMGDVAGSCHLLFRSSAAPPQDDPFDGVSALPPGFRCVGIAPVQEISHAEPREVSGLVVVDIRPSRSGSSVKIDRSGKGVTQRILVNTLPLDGVRKLETAGI